MSTLKISKHSDVLSALDLVREELDKEAKRIFSAGGDALKVGRIKPAQEAIAYAQKLGEFVKKIEKLGDEWKKLEARIDSAAPEVREIVQLPTKIRKTRIGFTRKVGKVAPKSNFTVTFPDGTVVADKKAKIVFAKAITHLGTEDVAALGIILGGEPLVAKPSAFKKMPTQIAPVGGGLVVKTHSSTATKMSLLSRISKRLGVKLKIEKV